MFAALSEELDATRRRSETQIGEAVERLGTNVENLRLQIDATDREVSTIGAAAFGRDGKGLREAALGLAITAMGILLTIAGLPW